MLSRAFRVFDADGKGYIGRADLERVLSSLGRGGDGASAADPKV